MITPVLVIVAASITSGQFHISAQAWEIFKCGNLTAKSRFHTHCSNSCTIEAVLEDSGVKIGRRLTQNGHLFAKLPLLPLKG